MIPPPPLVHNYISIHVYNIVQIPPPPLYTIIYKYISTISYNTKPKVGDQEDYKSEDDLAEIKG